MDNLRTVRPRAWHLAVFALVLGALVPAFLAAAASLGTITAQSLAGFPALVGTVTATMTDNFAGNGNLAGRTLGTGQVWTVHTGTWSTSGGRLRTTSSAAIQVASLPWISTPTQYVEVTTSFQGGSSATKIGVMSHVDAAGANGTLLEVTDTGSVQIARLSGGSTVTTLASTTGSTYAGTWRLSYNKLTGTYTASRNGTAVLTYVVPVPDRPTYEANRRVGVWASGTNSNARLDDFTAAAP